MSGGSLDYCYSKVEDAADSIDVNGDFCCKESVSKYHRVAFKKHLKKIAMALRAIEWNMSGDGDDNEIKLIEDCLGQNCDLKFLILDAESMVKMLLEKIRIARLIKTNGELLDGH